MPSLTEEEFVRRAVVSNIVGIVKFWYTLRDHPAEQMLYDGDQMIAEILERSGLRDEVIRVVGLYDRASNTSTDLNRMLFREGHAK